MRFYRHCELAKRFYRHCEPAKQPRNLMCTWIASQARNDDTTIPLAMTICATRHCEARSNPRT